MLGLENSEKHLKIYTKLESARAQTFILNWRAIEKQVNALPEILPHLFQNVHSAIESVG